MIHFKYHRSQNVTFNTSVYIQNTTERDYTVRTREDTYKVYCEPSFLSCSAIQKHLATGLNVNIKTRPQYGNSFPPPLHTKNSPLTITSKSCALSQTYLNRTASSAWEPNLT